MHTPAVGEMQQPADLLEFWPGDAEFKLPVGNGELCGPSGEQDQHHHQALGLFHPAAPMGLPHETAHNGDAIQHSAGHLAGLYGSGVGDHLHQQVCQDKRESGTTSQARRCCRPDQSPVGRLCVCCPRRTPHSPFPAQQRRQAPRQQRLGLQALRRCLWTPTRLHTAPKQLLVVE